MSFDQFLVVTGRAKLWLSGTERSENPEFVVPAAREVG
jgi:hypothetical protein